MRFVQVSDYTYINMENRLTVQINDVKNNATIYFDSNYFFGTWNFPDRATLNFFLKMELDVILVDKDWFNPKNNNTIKKKEVNKNGGSTDKPRGL